MSCLCQDRFKQTTADTVEEKPRIFATKFAEIRLGHAVVAAVWLGPTCIVRITSRVGPLHRLTIKAITQWFHGVFIIQHARVFSPVVWFVLLRTESDSFSGWSVKLGTLPIH